MASRKNPLAWSWWQMNNQTSYLMSPDSMQSKKELGMNRKGSPLPLNHETQHVDHPIGIADLVVVPGNQLEKA